MKRLFSLLLLMSILLAGCGDDGEPILPLPTQESVTTPGGDPGKLTLVFTADNRNVFAADSRQGSIGYGALAGYVQVLRDDRDYVAVLDGGDAIAMDPAMDGHYDDLIQIIRAVGYDFRVPGERELAFGREILEDWTDALSDTVYLSCNLVDRTTLQPVYAPYEIVAYGNTRVAYLGIVTPLAAGSDASLDFCAETAAGFYDTVQHAIDEARNAGADYVIALGHTGTAVSDSPWTAAEIIANTTGITVFLDGHSGSVLEGEPVTDMDDMEVRLCAVGSEFRYVAQVELDLGTGQVRVRLLDTLDGENRTVEMKVQALQDALEKESE